MTASQRRDRIPSRTGRSNASDNGVEPDGACTRPPLELRQPDTQKAPLTCGRDTQLRPEGHYDCTGVILLAESCAPPMRIRCEFWLGFRSRGRFGTRILYPPDSHRSRVNRVLTRATVSHRLPRACSSRPRSHRERDGRIRELVTPDTSGLGASGLGIY